MAAVRLPASVAKNVQSEGDPTALVAALRRAVTNARPDLFVEARTLTIEGR